MPGIQSHEVTVHVSDGTTMNAFMARPEGGDRHPALLVFQEAFGVNSHIRDVAKRFAREGFVAIAPELFHRTAPGEQFSYDNFEKVVPHMRAFTEEGLVADMRATCGWLTASDCVKADAIGSTGYCMGGRVSFLANAVLPLKAVVSYYGGGIGPGQAGPGLLGRTGELHAPMLFYWGGKDQHIPPEQRRAVTDALTAAHKPFVNVEFSEADHGFFCDQRPSYNAVAARQSWVLTLEFMRENLR
jgi:carboxymethylenebutenolidase